MSHLWRYRVQSSTVVVALVVNQAELAEEHGEHVKVLLEFGQTVLVGVRVVGDSIRQLESRTKGEMLGNSTSTSKVQC